MNILINKKDNKEHGESDVQICEWCDSVVELDKEDKHIGAYGGTYFTCPCCGCESFFDSSDCIELAPDNLEFPKHFARVNRSCNHVQHIDDESVVSKINELINIIRCDPTKHNMNVCVGDTFINVASDLMGEDFNIIVSRDFYKTALFMENI